MQHLMVCPGKRVADGPANPSLVRSPAFLRVLAGNARRVPVRSQVLRPKGCLAHACVAPATNVTVARS